MWRWYLFASVAVLFVALRLPGVGLPLHQDEYKWPMIVNPATNYGTNIPHPPLSQFIYQTGGALVGYDVHLRFVPLFFGLLNLMLLWLWVRMRAGERAAWWAAGIFTLAYFSILASLMVDTDGQILPFFLLLALIAYEQTRSDVRWWGAVALACVLGFLVKTSFIIAIGAIIADALWDMRSALRTRRAFVFGAIGAGSIVGLILILVLTQYLFPFFNLAASFSYWQHFVSLHHNWFQVAIQAIKGALYLSPLLVLLPVWASREEYAAVRPLVFFTGFGLLFYLVIFDFSVGALDRYLQFLIVPLAALAAVFLARHQFSRAQYRYLAIGGVISALFVVLQFLPHAVPALHPKAEWIGRILSLNWTFLYPFSGGSGPLTFYVSFLFVGLSWLAAGALIVLGVFRTRWQPVLLAMLLPLACTYNAVFTEEYLVGGINGYAPGLVERSVAYIRANEDVQKVIVYNDNGGDEVRKSGKYQQRLYTSPDFDWNQKMRTMNAFTGHYLVIDAPPVDQASFFAKYFTTCIPVYQDIDKYMRATVYDCRKAPPIVL